MDDARLVPVSDYATDKGDDFTEFGIIEPGYILFVHPSNVRDIRRLNAVLAGSPIVKHARRRGARGRKGALMKAWHPAAWQREEGVSDCSSLRELAMLATAEDDGLGW